MIGEDTLKKKGFTLIEIIVVLAILGILLTLTAPSVRESIDNNNKRDRVAHEEMINKAVRQYYSLEGKYPKEIKELKEKKFGPDIDEKKYGYKSKLNSNKEIIEVSVELK